MKIGEIFKIGDILGSFDGRATFLDRDNCIVENKSKSKNEDAVIFLLKRVSDGEEGKVYLKVRSQFESIADQLLARIFVNNGVMGLTLNELDIFETNIEIENVQGRLTIR